MAVGKKISEYSPDTMTYSGRIGKIAKEVIEGESTPSKFNVFLKDVGEYGKDIEVSLYKKAQGAATTRTGTVTFPAPTANVLLFNEWIQRTYPVRIDKLQIAESSTNGETAARNADEIVQTLYEGAEWDKNQNAMNAFSSLVAGNPNADGSTNIVTLGGAPEITDEATADAYLLAVKDAAKLMREGSHDANPYGLNVRSRYIVMIAPAQNVNRVDVYKRAGSFENKYTLFDVDEIIEYDPSMFEAMGAATLILDLRFAQFYERENEYEETKAKGNRGVDACLYTNNMYGICPLFNAVKIPQTAE